MPMNDVLTCQEVVELVTRYLENALLPEMRKRLEEHVDNCPGCATYLEQIRQTISMLHQLAQEPAFPASKQELLQVFRNWKRGA
jgi:predicted anti-sigma-YlaC factor YlaD